MNIVHIHSDVSGQIFQKQTGIRRISDDIDWVIFLDDDLELLPDCFDELIDCLAGLRDSNSILGVGLNCLNEESLEKNSFLHSKKGNAGKVLKSGRNISYMDSPEEIFTEWLNGASAWRKSVLPYYNFPLSNLKYAFAEDVIFSYTVGKKGKLLYLPRARVRFQQNTTFKSRSIDVWKAQAYWGLYFISMNNELSSFLFYLRLVAASAKFLIITRTNITRHFTVVIRDLWRILKFLCLKTKTQDFITTLSV